MTSVQESIFTYETGRDWNYYNDPTFEPPFLDELLASVDVATREEAEAQCGDNRECLFDSLAVGLELGSDSMTTGSDREDQQTTIGERMQSIPLLHRVRHYYKMCTIVIKCAPRFSSARRCTKNIYHCASLLPVSTIALVYFIVATIFKVCSIVMNNYGCIKSVHLCSIDAPILQSVHSCLLVAKFVRWSHTVVCTFSYKVCTLISKRLPPLYESAA